MMTWTLWLLLILPDGSFGTMKVKTFTNPATCEKAGAIIAANPPPSIKGIVAVCKETIDV